MKLLHIADRKPHERIWVPDFARAVRELGDLEIIENGGAMAEGDLVSRIQDAEVLLTDWGSAPVPLAIAKAPGRLRYICCVTGTIRRIIPVEIIEAGIPVTNWGDATSREVAEAALTLLLATVKNLPGRIRIIREGGWDIPDDFRSGVMELMTVGVYGCGSIARRFIDMLRPLGPKVLVFDPYARSLPEGVTRVNSLEELFSRSDAVAIHAGLTPETTGSVTAKHLAMLRDGGVLINTARGEIVDQDALLREVESGRLRAGIDVLRRRRGSPADLPPEHPARQWDSLILTAHCLSNPSPWPQTLQAMHRVCLDNLRRYIAGEPLRFAMDRARYELST